MSSEEEDKVLFTRYGIIGYSGSVGSPNAAINSIGSTPDNSTPSSEMGDDVDMMAL